LAVLWIAAPVALASCAKVWGIDDGLPYPDAAAGGDAPGDGTLAQDNAVEAPADTGGGSATPATPRARRTTTPKAAPTPRATSTTTGA